MQRIFFCDSIFLHQISDMFTQTYMSMVLISTSEFNGDSAKDFKVDENGYGSMVVLSLDSYSKLVQSVEFALNEADRLAETTSVRYTHGEVFEKIRNRVNK